MAKVSVSVMPALLLGVEQLEERPLLGVVGLRRIARRRGGCRGTFLRSGRRARAFRRVPKPQSRRACCMQQFGERFGQAVGQGFDHDRVVIVVLLVELAAQLVAADAGRDGEGAEVILAAAVRAGRCNRPGRGNPSALAAPTAGAACGTRVSSGCRGMSIR